MSRLFSKSTASAASLTGANQRLLNIAVLDALQSLGIQEGAISVITASQTLTILHAGVVLVDATAGNVNLTLPSSSVALDNAQFRFVRIDATANSVTITRGGSDTIDGVTTASVGITQRLLLSLPAGQTNWRALDSHYTDAARFFYTSKSSFGARLRTPSWGVAASGGPRLNLLRIEEDLSEAHLRLARVFIENKPYGHVIERFDKPATFFYIDPPYWGNENDYGKGIFAREDFERLADQLAKVKGKFLLSLNDKPEVRSTFKGFQIESVKTRYSIAAGKNTEVGEVLIRNYKS